MVDLHAGVPFEGRGGDVVVFADPEDGRVWVETWEDGVFDEGHGDGG